LLQECFLLGCRRGGQGAGAPVRVRGGWGRGGVPVPNADLGEGAASGLVLFFPAAFTCCSPNRSSPLGFFSPGNGKGSYIWRIGWPPGRSPGRADGEGKHPDPSPLHFARLSCPSELTAELFLP